jgi:hypothetical protein
MGTFSSDAGFNTGFGTEVVRYPDGGSSSRQMVGQYEKVATATLALAPVAPTCEAWGAVADGGDLLGTAQEALLFTIYMSFDAGALALGSYAISDSAVMRSTIVSANCGLSDGGGGNGVEGMLTLTELTPSLAGTYDFFCFNGVLLPDAGLDDIEYSGAFSVPVCSGSP